MKQIEKEGKKGREVEKTIEKKQREKEIEQLKRL